MSGSKLSSQEGVDFESAQHSMEIIQLGQG